MNYRLNRKWGITSFLTLLLATACHAEEPGMPQPTKEHKLLSQFAGEWDVTAETVPAPGQKAITCTGTESAQMVGGFWLIGKSEAAMHGTPVTNILTIGYDPETGKYVATSLCSMDDTLWKYEGTMDENGKKLTLETNGPSLLDPSQSASYRETLELKGKDRKVFTSYMQNDTGSWQKIISMEYHRKK